MKKQSLGWVIKENTRDKSCKFKQVPLTFLRAHAVEVDHGRDHKSAQRAQG